jgi:hypothetical protein
LIAESEQNLRNPAHPNAPDSHEMDVLGLKKHSPTVLFRLSADVSMRKSSIWEFAARFFIV